MFSVSISSILLPLSIAATDAGQEGPGFLVGDANLDGRISVADPLAIRRWFVEGDSALRCLDAADVDGDGRLAREDSLALFSEIFVAPGGGKVPLELRHFFASPQGEVGPPEGVLPDAEEPALGCEDPSIREAETTDEVVRFGEVPALAGGRVAIPVHIDSSNDLDAFQLVIRYDPEVFVPDDVLTFANFFRAPEQLRREIFQGTLFEDRVEADREQMLLQVRSFPEEGLLVVAFYSNLFGAGSEIPTGSSTPVFNIVGTVSAQVSPEQTLTLEPEDGGFGSHQLRNELVHRGSSRFLATRPTVEVVTLSIIPDISIFSRGDANLDGFVDASDVVRILTRLFLVDPTPFACRDAADVNDDGELGIADAVAALMHLFIGAFTIPEPYPLPGLDPTPDSLNCAAPWTTRQP